MTINFNTMISRLLPKLLASLSLLACTKPLPVSSFTGTLPIVKTVSPTVVAAGQDINTKVRLKLTSVSGSVVFEGFDIIEKGNKVYAITASAYFEDWNRLVGSSMMWTRDTSVTVKTTTPGMYVLHFYNGEKLFKSDTVRVN